jgi:hypothetical protein
VQACLKLVSEQFPHVQERVARLFGQDETFRELCEEYEACVGAARRLGASGPDQEAIRREYQLLQLRLEGELLRYLQES